MLFPGVHETRTKLLRLYGLMLPFQQIIYSVCVTLAENESERNRKVQSIAEIMRELLQRESNQKIVQANMAYESEIAKIEGAD